MKTLALLLTLLPAAVSASEAPALDLSVIYEQARRIAVKDARADGGVRVIAPAAPAGATKGPVVCHIAGPEGDGYRYRCSNGTTFVRPSEPARPAEPSAAPRLVPQLILPF